MYRKHVNRLRKSLHLPRATLDMDMTEEQMFMELYDISTFANSDNQYIQQMWMDKMQRINSLLNII